MTQEGPRLPVDGPLIGCVVVATGTLATMTRDDARARILRAGGTATDSVSRKTTFVVAGPGAGSKLATAERLGVAVVDEEAFLEILDGRRPVPSEGIPAPEI
jgi:DNA ligase (NAD+)